MITEMYCKCQDDFTVWELDTQTEDIRVWVCKCCHDVYFEKKEQGREIFPGFFISKEENICSLKLPQKQAKAK